MTVADARESSRVRTVVDPTPDDAAELVADGIDAGALVTLFGRCTVAYDGRASSTLGPGDRHVMLKPDGSILVHTDESQQPVNWQPPGCTQEVDVEDGDLRLDSRRTTPDERLVVQFRRIGQVSAFAVDDTSELALSGTEEDLRERIIDDPSLLEAGFTPLSTERQTSAGAVDIYGEDDRGRAVAVELKRRRVGPDAVSQLRRYVDALERDLHDDAEVRGMLVAPSVTERAQRLLERHGLEFVSLAPEKRSDGDD